MIEKIDPPVERVMYRHDATKDVWSCGTVTAWDKAKARVSMLCPATGYCCDVLVADLAPVSKKLIAERLIQVF